MMLHPQEHLADDVQAAARQQMVDVGDPPRDRIVDGDHGVARLPLVHRGEGVLERVAGQGLELGQPLAARQMREGAWHALERHRLIGGATARDGGGLGHGRARLDQDVERSPRSRRARSRSAGVSTPKGTVSTNLTPMLMPFSSARSCSSFSRRSSGLCGRPQ